MRAIVMAGGEGTRLRPLTSNQPKPMVPVVGKPCMEHIVDLLCAHGLTDITVTLAFLPQAIESYFGDGEALGASIDYSLEATPMGTAGSVRLAAQRLDEPFLVISGDALTDFDLTALVRFHTEREAAVTIALKAVDNPLDFGIVVTGEDGRIERFLEKPTWGQVFSDTINTGIYVLDPGVLRHIPDDRPFDFSKELFPRLLELGRPMYGHVCEGYWQDIGNLEQYRQANFDALDKQITLDIPGIRLRGNIWIGEGVEIDDLAGVEGPAFVGNYCAVSPEATIGAYSVLGANVRLRERARVVRSIIDQSTFVGRGASVEGAIVGKSCDLRSHVHVHDGAALGDGVTLGAQTVVMPDVRIFPHKDVESGATVYESLVWEGGGQTHLFGREGVSGVVNVDLTPEAAVRLAAASRNHPPAWRSCRRQPGRNAGLPHDQAGNGLRPHVDRHQHRRPPRAARAGQSPRHPHTGLRGRLPRRDERRRPRAARDPVLRAHRDTADAAAREGGREALHTLRAAAGGAGPDRQDRLPGSRA